MKSILVVYFKRWYKTFTVYNDYNSFKSFINLFKQTNILNLNIIAKILNICRQTFIGITQQTIIILKTQLVQEKNILDLYFYKLLTLKFIINFLLEILSFRISKCN